MCVPRVSQLTLPIETPGPAALPDKTVVPAPYLTWLPFLFTCLPFSLFLLTVCFLLLFPVFICLYSSSPLSILSFYSSFPFSFVFVPCLMFSFTFVCECLMFAVLFSCGILRLSVWKIRLFFLSRLRWSASFRHSYVLSYFTRVNKLRCFLFFYFLPLTHFHTHGLHSLFLFLSSSPLASCTAPTTPAFLFSSFLYPLLSFFPKLPPSTVSSSSHASLTHLPTLAFV